MRVELNDINHIDQKYYDEGDDADDWVEIEDQNSGRTYFWNRATNLTSWNKPDTYTDVNGVKVEASSS